MGGGAGRSSLHREPWIHPRRLRHRQAALGEPGRPPGAPGAGTGIEAPRSWRTNVRKNYGCSRVRCATSLRKRYPPHSNRTSLPQLHPQGSSLDLGLNERMTEDRMKDERRAPPTLLSGAPLLRRKVPGLLGREPARGRCPAGNRGATGKPPGRRDSARSNSGSRSQPALPRTTRRYNPPGLQVHLERQILPSRQRCSERRKAAAGRMAVGRCRCGGTGIPARGRALQFDRASHRYLAHFLSRVGYAPPGGTPVGPAR